MIQWKPWPPADGEGHTVTGEVLHAAAVEAPALGNQRDLFVVLPPAYTDDARRFPVVYAQDGQNLFDRALAFGGQEWHVDEALALEAGRADAIIVGIANTGETRIHEYSPVPDERLGGGGGDAYIDFVTGTVKPAVDAAFRTLPDRANTFIAGSSMGGLIALHGFFARPDVFGGVAALSPSLWFADRSILETVGDAEYSGGRVYIDTGTREGAGQLLDVARLREALLAKGYRRGDDLLTVIEPGGRHSEEAWARRFPRALRFLLGTEPAETGFDPKRSALRLRRSAARKRKLPG